jgi:hypothetical protein
MTEDIRNKFVSWTLNVVKEIKEIPVGTCGQHNNQGNIYGVGVNLSLVPSSSASNNNNNNNNHHQRYNRVGVDSVEPAGPAAKAGLKPGDVIVKVDDKAFDDPKRAYLPDDVAGAIRGPEGSEVDVVVERDGKRVEFVLTREPIGVPSPPSSPARKEKAEKKASTVEQQQAKKKKQGISKSIQSEDALFKQDEACTKGETKNENENATSTETNKEAPHSERRNLITCLALSEEEQKEESNSKDLASSAEDADQFDDDAADAPTPRHANFLISGVPPLFARAASIDTEISEEKTADDDNNNNNNNNNDNELSSILNNSVGDDWDMISERSGSAIVISFSGSVSGGACSFRSASPSMLKNKFVLTESAGEPYIDHVVLPTDTLQGLCLAYKISATRLRMENNFSGNSLRMAPKKLRIPAGAPSSQSQSGSMIRTQDKTSAEFKLYAFVAEIPSMELVEAKAYLDLSNWDLDEALRSAREDEGWSLKGGFEQQQLQQHELSERLGPVVAAKPKTLTAMDIHAAPPTFEGAGFELKDIRRSGS